MGKRLASLFVIVAAMLFTLPVSAQNPYAKKASVGPRKLPVAIYPGMAEKAKVMKLKAEANANRLTEMVEKDRAEKARFVEEMTEQVMKTVIADPRSLKDRKIVMLSGKNVQGLSQRNPFMTLTAPVTHLRKAGEVKDSHGIITEPGEGETKYYTRTGAGFYNNSGYIYSEDQSGYVEIVECEDGTVYIKDIISHYKDESWVKGVKEGNTITVPSKQPLGWSDNYSTTLSLRWVFFDSSEETFSAADDHADSFTFTVDGDVISLEGTNNTDFSTDAYWMAVIWDDDNNFSGYADAETVWTLDETYEPPTAIVLPEGVVAETWYASATAVSNSGNTKYKGEAQVAFDGNDVYLQVFADEFPDAWMKGTLDGTTVTFPDFQFLGNYSGYEIFAIGTDGENLEDFTMTYDADAKTLTANNDLLANASTEKIYYLHWYQNLVISAEAPEELKIDELPYSNGFDSEDDFDMFTVIDANEDGRTWSLTSGTVGYTYSSSSTADDWLISPAIKLEAGKFYHFAIDAWDRGYVERFEVMMGNEATASALTSEVIGATETDGKKTVVTYENGAVAVEEDGYYYFGIHCISDADEWMLYVDNFLVEEGAAPTAPDAVTDLVVTPFEDGTIGATITFNAPKTNIDGTDITENITKIEVIRDGNVIATLTDVEPGAECNVVDDATDLVIGNHKYAVIAYNAEGPGRKSEEVVVYLNGILNVPYFADFAQSGTFDIFTVIDANEDDYTWESDDGAYYRYNQNNGADDYLITAPIRMKAGSFYSVTVNAGAGMSSFPERMEVLLGKEASVDGMTVTLIEPTEVATSADDYKGSFTVEEDGIYYVAIHAISDADMYRLYVYSLAIDVLSPTAPMVVTDFNVEPGAEGALNATVSCNAPETSFDGNAIEGNLTMVVVRDGEILAQVADVAPGGAFTYDDESIVAAGAYSYVVYAINEAGEIGDKVDAVSVFVGCDIPMAVEEMSYQDQVGKVLFEWEEVGEEVQNGGYVNPDEVKYSIWSVELYDFYGWTIPEFTEKLGEVTGEDNLTIDLDISEGTEQEIRYYGIKTENDQTDEYGVEGTMVPLCFGPAYEMPFEEHVAGGNVSYPTWMVQSSSDYISAYLWNDSSDGDGHALALYSEDEEGGYVALATGKINLNNATNPVLMFDFQRPEEVADLEIVIGQPNADGTVIEQVFPVGEDWQSAKVELKDFASADYVQIMFLGSFEGEGYIALDNIIVFDQLEDNLVVDLTAPKSVVAGKTAPVTISLRNMGANVAEDFTLKLTAGDEELEINEPVEALEPMATATFTAEFAPSVFTEAGDVTLKVEAAYDYDLDDDDNVAETVITVKAPVVTAPASLVAAAEGSKANLEWAMAEGDAAVEVTEDFEDTETFPAWSLGGIDASNQTGAFGDWTVYDGNNMGVYSFQGIPVPNMGTDYPAAWQVINSEAGAEFYDEFPTSYPAASGEQFLWSICPVDESSAPEADHWLISPELPGVAHTISFNAKQLSSIDPSDDGYYGLETFEVLASSTDSQIESFSLVSDNQISSADWAEFTADLPEGTKFFAIRHTSQDIFGLLIDDVKYMSSSSTTPTGFNIYVDEVLVGSVEGDVLTYVTGELPVGDHKVSVTALYGSNESLPVDAWVTIEVPTAIEEVINAEGLMNIYNLNGMKVQGDTKQLQKGTYIINNKKVVVK